MAGKKRKAAEISIDINANVAQLAKDMNRAVGELDKLQKKVGGLQKIMAASFTLDLGKTLLPTLKEFGTIIGTIAGKGDEAGSIAEQFNKLGGSASQLDAAKTATQGLVGQFDLMRIATEALLRQIPGVNENFGKIADIGARVAGTLGISTKEGIERVVDALAQAEKKQLQAIGVTIDADKAYSNYAKSIGQTAQTLSDAQKVEARQIAALGQLDSALNKLAPAGDSVANAMDAVNVAIDDGIKQFGIAINSNDELMAAYRQLANTLDDVDWAALGTAASQFFSTVLGAASAALPTIIQWVDDANRGFQYLFGQGIQAQADRSAEKLITLKKELDGIDLKVKSNPFQGSLGKALGLGWSDDAVKAEKKKISDLIAAEEENFKKLNTQIEAQKTKTSEAVTATGNVTAKIEGLNRTIIPAIKNTGKSSEALAQQAKAADTARKELEKLDLSWKKYLRNSQQQKDSEVDLGSISNTDYQQLRERLTTAVRESFYDEWKDKIKLGGKNYEEVMKAANEEVNRAGEQLDKERNDKQKQYARDWEIERQRQLQRMYQGADQIGQQLGVDLSGVFNQLQQNFGTEMSSMLDKLAKSLGMEGDGAGAALGSYIGTGLQVISAGLEAKGKDKATKSNAGTGAAVGAGAGMAIGAIWGPAGAALGAEIGKVAGEMIGSTMKWGPQNADTKSRHVFANWLEDQLNSLQAVGLFDRNGQFRTARGSAMNFVEGDTGRFNKPGWADEMSKWGEDARTMFVGLGNALKETLGITEKVGAQIGYLLGENLAGNIDNARLLVFELGLSIDDLSEALLKMAKRGEITWGEYAAQVASLGEAFKPGLQAVGDLTGAVNELYGSGGRGMAALKAIKDIAQEAIDLKATNIDQLQQLLVQKGISPEEAAAIANAFKQQGIKTLQEVANLSEAQTGQIVASIGAQSDAVRKKWEEVSTSLEKIKWDMDQLPTEKDIEINFKGKFDATMQKAADAGLLENGNSTLSPVDNTASTTAKNARVSASQVRMASAGAGAMKAQSVNAFSISIDARGADAGVEDKIHTIITGYQDVIAKNAASMVVDYQSRGG